MSKTKYKNQQAIDEFRKKFVNENSLDYAGRASLKVIHPEAVEQFLDEQLEKKEEEVIEHLNMGIRRLSGQWEGQTKEWVEGNQTAFTDILRYIETQPKK